MTFQKGQIPWNIGRKHPEGVRMKISQINKGRKLPLLQISCTLSLRHSRPLFTDELKLFIISFVKKNGYSYSRVVYIILTCES